MDYIHRFVEIERKKLFTIIKALIFNILIFFSPCYLFAQHLAFQVNEKDLIPEGIAFDSLKNQFYLSSISKNKIVKVSKYGQQKQDFIKSKQDGFGGGLGLHVDTKHRLLYACWGDISANTYQTGVYAYHLDKKVLVKSFQLSKDTLPNFFNDLVISNKGDVFITNTFDNSIWEWKIAEEKPKKLIINVNIKFPNGICLSDNQQFLFVATADGLLVINLGNQETKALQVTGNEFSTKNLDGIAFYQNSIVAVQNSARDKSKHKVLRYFLHKDFSKIEQTVVLDVNNPYFDIPTTLALINNELYVLANSQMENIDEQKKVKFPNKLKKIAILKYKLE
ncbi:MAG: SMP-30/gluconolactonase/LRE family protein [Thermoflexibacter sp.]|jgi:hypothetical protein|nr:SMP-30/gluconolactonase/LRE family protein [Thermoflexibacter sp.]